MIRRIHVCAIVVVVGSILGYISATSLRGVNRAAFAQDPPARSDDKAEPAELDRTHLPIPEPKIVPSTVLDARNAKAPPRFEVKAPKASTKCFDHFDRRHGLWSIERIWRPDPHADRGEVGEKRASIQPVPHHRTLLADASGAPVWPQSPRLQHGLDHRNRHGVSRSDRAAPNSVAPLAEMLRLNGYSTAAFGKSHETAAWEVSPSGPTDRWPTRSGFDKFYGFIGGETNQWAPAIYEDMSRVEIPKDLNYHFMNDMTNQAIKWSSARKH